MQCSVIASLGLVSLALTSCSSTPPAYPDRVTKEFPDNCAVLDSSYGTGAPDLVFGTLASGQCGGMSKMSLAPDSNTQDGVFHSTDGAVSVSVPELKAGNDGHPLAQVWEDHPERSGKIYITPTPGDGVVYTIYPLSWLKLFAPKDLMELEDRFLHNPNFTAQMMIGGANQEHVFRASTTLADGSPAILEILRPRGDYNELGSDSAADDTAKRPFLIYYLIKSGGQYSVLAVFWSKPCDICSTGPESAIRAMDPRIAALVGSFKRTAQQ